MLKDREVLTKSDLKADGTMTTHYWIAEECPKCGHSLYGYRCYGVCSNKDCNYACRFV
jgi:hypothetical protein